MRVTTIYRHENDLGEERLKKVGDEYEAGDHAEVLIAGELAVPADPAVSADDD